MRKNYKANLIVVKSGIKYYRVEKWYNLDSEPKQMQPSDGAPDADSKCFFTLIVGFMFVCPVLQNYTCAYVPYSNFNFHIFVFNIELQASLKQESAVAGKVWEIQCKAQTPNPERLGKVPEFCFLLMWPKNKGFSLRHSFLTCKIMITIFTLQHIKECSAILNTDEFLTESMVSISFLSVTKSF